MGRVKENIRFKVRSKRERTLEGIERRVDR